MGRVGEHFFFKKIYIYIYIFFFKVNRCRRISLFRKSSAFKRYGAEMMLSPLAHQSFLQDAHEMPNYCVAKYVGIGIDDFF